jgi:hypothetical protein
VRLREAPAKELVKENHTTVLSQFALVEVLDGLKASDSTDVIRSALQVVLQAVIEAEATAVIYAAPQERIDARTTRATATATGC